MVATSSRFGTIEYEEQDVLHFVEGPYGFSNLRDFVLVQHKTGSVFRWMQSLQEPSVAFLVLSPHELFPYYQPSISDEIAASLSLKADDPILIYVIVTIPPGNPKAMTANLAGPIIINPRTRQARQVIVEEEEYGTKHSIAEAIESITLSAA